MIPEVGHFALILALCLNIAAVMGPFYREGAQRAMRVLGLSVFFCITVSALTLIFSFMTDDFSVAYVAYHSNTNLLWFYKLTALWGSHEGSILLWLWVLSGWTLVAANLSFFGKEHTTSFRVLAFLQAGLSLYILATSNPFLRLMPNTPVEGADLNPLLQDIAFVIHPPILYAGLVGLSLPFAFALGALWHKSWPSALIKNMRLTSLLSWSFLTLGIALGSWWAYYELGWGGWWFWDPVENASLMPWLVSTALLHLLITYQKRKAFLSLMAFCAILPFVLSLIGTFLTRSGVLSSVHAFASDPTRGAYLLGFIGLVSIAALGLYAFRLPLPSENKGEGFSKEMMMFIQAIFMLVMCAIVLLGTFYPILIDLFLNEKLSVGPAYFNAVLVPIFLLMLMVMSFGPWLKWSQDTFKPFMKPLLMGCGLIVVGVLLATFFKMPIASLMGLSITALVLLVSIDGVKKYRLAYLLSSPMFWGHFGVLVLTVGISLSVMLETEREVALSPNQKVEVGGYLFQLKALSSVRGGNYEGVRASMDVYRNNRWLKTLYPEKRYYFVREMAISETAIAPGLFVDWYVALGEPLNNDAWSLRIYIKPFVRWIWLGGLMLAFSGFLSCWKQRKMEYKPVNAHEVAHA